MLTHKNRRLLSFLLFCWATLRKADIISPHAVCRSTNKKLYHRTLSVIVGLPNVSDVKVPPTPTTANAVVAEIMVYSIRMPSIMAPYFISCLFIVGLHLFPCCCVLCRFSAIVWLMHLRLSVVPLLAQHQTGIAKHSNCRSA